MRALQYFFAEAASSLWRSRGPAAMAIATIAAGMFVLGLLLLVNLNVQRLVDRWGNSAEISVFLADDVVSPQVESIRAVATRSEVVAACEYVSKDQARERFRSAFPDLAATAGALDRNPFPASLEIRLRPGASAAAIDGMVNTVQSMPGVADVRYDQQWLERLGRIARGLRIAGLVIVGILSLAAAMTVASVVRLAAAARREEIDIMELVGAPFAYVRGPFVVEGILQGGMGAALAVGALLVAAYMVRLKVAGITFLPLPWTLLLLAGGMVLGCLGGYVAARQVR